MSYSWFLDPDVPSNEKSFPTQATYFGSSSLASSSSSFLASDFGKQEQTLIKMTGGNRQLNNLAIVDTDKSALGMSIRARAANLSFTRPPPNMLTVPNKFSLSRNTLL
jgi:hypothetical protein